MNENKYIEQLNETMGENSFMKKLLKKRLNQKGLTLIEILAVIVILAIVAAIAIPAIGNVIQNSRYDGAKTDALSILNAANLYYSTETGTTTSPVTPSVLITEGYLESEGDLKNASVTNNGGTLELTADAVTISGANTLKFTSATIETINADEFKGSDLNGTRTINATGSTGGTTTTTPPTN